MAKGERPQWRLAALDKVTGQTGNIGAGWNSAQGRISLKLNAFVTLEAGKDLVLTLFPDDGQYNKPRPVPSAEEHDEDIPF